MSLAMIAPRLSTPCARIASSLTTLNQASCTIKAATRGKSTSAHSMQSTVVSFPVQKRSTPHLTANQVQSQQIAQQPMLIRHKRTFYSQRPIAQPQQQESIHKPTEFSHSHSAQETLDQLNREAQEGKVESTLELARIYSRGDESLGIASDDRQALLWLTLAAVNQNSPSAYGELGKRYLAGRGCRRSPNDAITFFQKGAQLNDKQSQATLSLMLHKGLVGLDANRAEAMRLARQAAQQGHVGAQFHLAQMLIEAIEEKQNAAQPSSLEQAQASQPINSGEEPPQAESASETTHEPEAELMQMLRSAAQQHHQAAKHILGKRLLNSRTRDSAHDDAKIKQEAYQHLRQAADAGLTQAQATLAHHLVVEDAEYDTALPLLRQASQDASLEAQCLLGRLLNHLTRDQVETCEERREALQWLACAAESQRVEAWLLLAHVAHQKLPSARDAKHASAISATAKTYCDQVIEHVHAQINCQMSTQSNASKQRQQAQLHPRFERHHATLVNQLRADQDSATQAQASVISSWLAQYERVHERPWLSTLPELLEAQKPH